MANGIGALVIAGFMLWLAPSVNRGQLNAIAARSLPVFVVFIVVSLPVGHFIASRSVSPIQHWLAARRAPRTKIA